MNHDPNSCESFDPLLAGCQKHDRHHSMFRVMYIQNNGLVMVAQADSPHPLWLGRKQGLWHWNVVSSDPEGNEVCYQAACKVFAVSTAPCGVQSYRCSESHVVEKRTPAPDRQILICVRAHAGMLWGGKKKSTLWEYVSSVCLGFLAPGF